MTSLVSLIPIPYTSDSVIWFQQIRHLPEAIWLDSGRPVSTLGRYDIMAAAPAVNLKTHGGVTYIQQNNEHTESQDNPMSLIRRYLVACSSLPDIPFCGGALGYFGYDLGRRFENLPELAAQDIELPDMAVGIYPWALIQDHQLQKSWLLLNHALSPAYNFSIIQGICAQAPLNPVFHEARNSLRSGEKDFKISKIARDLNVGAYRRAIAKIQSYIAAGDCYQVNFAQRFSATYLGDSFAAYVRLRDAMPSPFSAYMALDNGSILSFSPERFIKLENGQAETKPIKGTIARGVNPVEDDANARQLQDSLKDRAENLMIVDLLRNDLSKSCTQVTVPRLFELQSFANVHHLVSTITGQLRPEKDALDLLADSFPGGSITGAPKIRAMEIIEELEPVRRAVYCGSLGYISSCGTMDTNIAIRTVICDHQKLYCWGGGGIVADSEVDKEFQESLTKVALLLDTLEAEFFSTDI